nr:uncharacterized protein LOC127315586 [Lolium perenne]
MSRHGFLPTPNPPSWTIRGAPPNLPPTNARPHGLEALIAVSPWTLAQGLEEEEGDSRARGSTPLPAGGNNLHRTTTTCGLHGSRPDEAARTNQAPPGPAEPNQAREVLAAKLQQAGHGVATTLPPPPRLFRHQGSARSDQGPTARQAQIGPERGPRSWPNGGRRHHPSRPPLRRQRRRRCASFHPTRGFHAAASDRRRPRSTATGRPAPRQGSALAGKVRPPPPAPALSNARRPAPAAAQRGRGKRGPGRRGG